MPKASVLAWLAECERVRFQHLSRAVDLLFTGRGEQLLRGREDVDSKVELEEKKKSQTSGPPTPYPVGA